MLVVIIGVIYRILFCEKLCSFCYLLPDGSHWGTGIYWYRFRSSITRILFFSCQIGCNIFSVFSHSLSLRGSSPAFFETIFALNFSTPGSGYTFSMRIRVQEALHESDPCESLYKPFCLERHRAADDGAESADRGDWSAQDRSLARPCRKGPGPAGPKDTQVRSVQAMLELPDSQVRSVQALPDLQRLRWDQCRQCWTYQTLRWCQCRQCWT